MNHASTLACVTSAIVLTQARSSSFTYAPLSHQTVSYSSDRNGFHSFLLISQLLRTHIHCKQLQFRALSILSHLPVHSHTAYIYSLRNSIDSSGLTGLDLHACSTSSTLPSFFSALSHMGNTYTTRVLYSVLAKYYPESHTSGDQAQTSISQRPECWYDLHTFYVFRRSLLIFQYLFL